MKKEKRISAVCLIIIGFGTVILSVSSIAGIELPDLVKGLIGIVDLIVTPVFVYTSFKIVANQPSKK